MAWSNGNVYIQNEQWAVDESARPWCCGAQKSDSEPQRQPKYYVSWRKFAVNHVSFRARKTLSHAKIPKKSTNTQTNFHSFSNLHTYAQNTHAHTQTPPYHLKHTTKTAVFSRAWWNREQMTFKWFFVCFHGQIESTHTLYYIRTSIYSKKKLKLNIYTHIHTYQRNKIIFVIM